MNCSACGAVVQEGAAFCGSCGRSIVGHGTGASPEVGTPAVPISGTGHSMHYAGFWLRFVAILIDSIVIGVVAIVVLRLTGGRSAYPLIGVGAPEGFRPPLRVVSGLQFTSLIGQWLYFALMESSSWQATLGKKALGLYVTDLQGRRIGFGQATGRYFSKIISAFILFIGFLMAGFTEKKQALHDKIAGCLVLRNE